MNNDEVMAELNKTLNNISLDIRQIMTTLGHFEEKFQGTEKSIESIRETAKENHEEVQKTIIKVSTLESESADTKRDVEILFDKFKHRDQKSDTDRKWLVGTVISVGVLFVGVVGLFISFVGMTS